MFLSGISTVFADTVHHKKQKQSGNCLDSQQKLVQWQGASASLWAMTREDFAFSLERIFSWAQFPSVNKMCNLFIGF